jgi:hypothetical protein
LLTEQNVDSERRSSTPASSAKADAHRATSTGPILKQEIESWLPRRVFFVIFVRFRLTFVVIFVHFVADLPS